ncbi:hypothetical protein T265_00761 [Opisthorchis viverrini]|uniref:Uncharacterized protein n=1 Tax=Opisthorchis viverrini TaxID=6198 RepID=A0A075A154_OPIVI|nr:hypothetical protein T265_00761 [Opisthorchis viverrini]KER33458.1 hypothetical protein T265_00761 [Opisthorchis viverrini]
MINEQENVGGSVSVDEQKGGWDCGTLRVPEGDSYGSNTELQQQSSNKPQGELSLNLIQDDEGTLQHHRTAEEGIGQTWRRPCTRIKERNATRRRHDTSSLISIHEEQEGRKFDLENAKILA